MIYNDNTCKEKVLNNYDSKSNNRFMKSRECSSMNDVIRLYKAYIKIYHANEDENMINILMEAIIGCEVIKFESYIEYEYEDITYLTIGILVVNTNDVYRTELVYNKLGILGTIRNIIDIIFGYTNISRSKIDRFMYNLELLLKDIEYGD